MCLSNEDSEEGKRGSLKKAMQGTSDAVQNWELKHTETMTEAGFRKGSLSARVIYHEQKKVKVVAHGDDFTVLGPSKSLDWVRGGWRLCSRAYWRGAKQDR
jgi:hypothetical protein